MTKLFKQEWNKTGLINLFAQMDQLAGRKRRGQSPRQPVYGCLDRNGLCFHFGVPSNEGGETFGLRGRVSSTPAVQGNHRAYCPDPRVHQFAAEKESAK